MKSVLLIIALAFAVLCTAQDQTIQNLQTEAGKTITKDTSDTTHKIWKFGGVFSLNVAQGSLSNWAAGGDKFSLAANTFLNAYAYYKKDRHSWDNNFDYYLGYVKTTSTGTRKNDDRFELYSKYGYALNPKWNLSGLFDLRSQFFKGYNYPDATTKVYTSNFFAPAYLLLSPGFDYHPVSNLSIFLSPATARWTFMKDTLLSTSYGLEAGEKDRFEFGAYVTINYTANLGKVVTYKGKLDLFSNYKHKPQNVDLYFTNLFAAKLSKAISATWNFTLIYDDDVKLFGDNHDSPGLQLQSLIGIGILVKL